MTTPTLFAHAPASGVSSLEANLEICQAQIRKALARAEAIVDEYGQTSSQAHAAAMRYLKMSAKIGLALAKMKGEHTSIIHVHKTETVLPPPPKPVFVPERRSRPALAEPVLTPAERAERRANVDKIYNDWLATRATERAESHAGDDPEADDEFEEEEDREEGDPPTNFGGSNTSEP